jgi:hypothetical protein
MFEIKSYMFKRRFATLWYRSTNGVEDLNLNTAVTTTEHFTLTDLGHSLLSVVKTLSLNARAAW